MNNNIDLEILNLDWLTKIVGTHLNLENLVQEIVAFLKNRVHAKKMKLFLWDEAQKRFYTTRYSSPVRS
jgi:hypothetical protein